MASNANMARRSLLLAIGGGVVGATSVGSAQDRGRASDRDTTSEGGVVIQYESCFTVHIRGRPHDVFQVQLSFVFLEDGLIGTGFYTIDEPNLPLTIKAEETAYGEYDPYISGVGVFDHDLQPINSASPPPGWNCLDELS
ncbi:hypothetical protein [Natronosalvus vescus]|uniref:hypothetical protein n=1 Tax=Natronosalvus vescus TaxID=2953881 RepID=UPI00209153C0|nr:hypothetical protein [Natronosalvus vescus]